ACPASTGANCGRRTTRDDPRNGAAAVRRAQPVWLRRSLPLCLQCLSSGTGRLAGCRGQSPGPLPVTADAGSARSGSLDPCGGARTMSGPLPALELLDIAKTYRVGSSMLSRKHELRAVRNV